MFLVCRFNPIISYTVVTFRGSCRLRLSDLVLSVFFNSQLSDSCWFQSRQLLQTYLTGSARPFIQIEKQQVAPPAAFPLLRLDIHENVGWKTLIPVSH